MRKLFTIVICIFLCISIYFGIKMIISYLQSSYIIAKDAYTDSYVTGSFAFKVTPENFELVNSYLKINNTFINELTKEVTREKNIENINKLFDKMPNFKSYYSAKLKLEKAVFDEMPILLANINSLSESNLDDYMNDNLAYLDEIFGITDSENFNSIISNLSYLNDKNITYCEIVKNSILYNPYGNNTMFRMKVGSSESDFVYFSVNTYHTATTENQTAPVIIFNAAGGIS